MCHHAVRESTQQKRCTAAVLYATFSFRRAGFSPEKSRVSCRRPVQALQSRLARWPNHSQLLLWLDQLEETRKLRFQRDGLDQLLYISLDYAAGSPCCLLEREREIEIYQQHLPMPAGNDSGHLSSHMG